MQILVLGGTGAIGIHLCNILSDGGNDVYVTSRNRKQNINSITYVQGNAHNRDFLNSLLIEKKWDAIIDFMSYSTNEFRERVSPLLENTSQYVFLSSSRVYADCQSPITEDSPRLLDVCTDQTYLSTDEYALTKARQEDILRNSGKSNWTIIRPYITFSENRLQLSPAEKEFWLYDALEGRTIMFSKDLAEKYTTLTYGYDVARAIGALIGQVKAYGEAFHITVEESYQWSEILDNYINVIEQKKGYRPHVKWLETWTPIIGGMPMQVKWDRLYNRRFDNSKISKFIDTGSFKKTLPALSDCLSSFIETPLYGTINWEFKAKRDKIYGDWANLSDIEGIKKKIKYIKDRLF